MRLIPIGLILAVAAVSTFLDAYPLTYTLSGMLSGALGNNTLTDVSFKFVVNADTNAIYGATPPSDPAISTLVTLGTSTGTFTEAIYAGGASSAVSGIVGITAVNDKDGGITFQCAQLANYVLGNAIDVSCPAPYYASGNLATSLGALTITGAENLTFIATPQVPEPSTAELAAFAGMGKFVLRARRWR